MPALADVLPHLVRLLGFGDLQALACCQRLALVSNALVEQRFQFSGSNLLRLLAIVKASNLLIDGRVPTKGQQIEYSNATLLGLRGVAVISHKQLPIRNPGDEPKIVNEVKTFLTDKPKLLRNFPVQEDAFVDPETGGVIPF